jgi:phage terminase small subunit
VERGAKESNLDGETVNGKIVRETYPPVKKPPMNAKRRKFLLALSKGLTIAEATRKAGYSGRAGYNTLKSLRQTAPEILEQIGCPVERLLKKFVDKLEAKETKFFDNRGVVIETREVEAHEIQLRAGVELAKLHNLYPQPEYGNIAQSSGPTVHMVVTDARIAEGIMERLAERSAVNRQPSLVDAERDEDAG